MNETPYFSKHLMTVDNNDEGKRLIAELRKSIRASKRPLRIVFYGRGHRHGQGKLRRNPNYVEGGRQPYFSNSNRYQSSLPMNKAQRLAVYLKSK